MRIEQGSDEQALAIVTLDGRPQGIVWACDTEEGWVEFLMLYDVHGNTGPRSKGSVLMRHVDGNPLYRFYGRVEIPFWRDPTTFEMPEGARQLYGI